MIDRIASLIRTGLKTLLVALIAVLLAVMSVQIVMRYSFNASLIWAEEVCRYLLIWVSMLAAVFAYERGEVAAVTLLMDSLSRRAGLMVAILCNLCGVVLCAVLVWYGLRYADLAGSQPVPALRFIFEDGFGLGTDVVPSVYWVYVALPAGMALLGARIALDVARQVIALRRGGGIADMAPGP